MTGGVSVAAVIARSIVVALASSLVIACAAQPSRNPLCTCEVGQKFDGTACVAPADFVAPTDCVDDAVAVCGCDDTGYSSKCAAYAVGVEVAHAGACSSTSNNSGGFGW